MQIVQRHHFASHLKRMAVVARVDENFIALVKVKYATLQYIVGGDLVGGTILYSVVTSQAGNPWVLEQFCAANSLW